MVNTKLQDRVLWADGDTTISTTAMTRLLIDGKSTVGMFVDELTADIVQYNKFIPNEKLVRVKKNDVNIDFGWNIPQEYSDVDVIGVVMDALSVATQDMSKDDTYERKMRISRELDVFSRHDLFPMLCAIIYIISTLNKNNIVWGVGRGSSVSSYVLYLLGVHDIDSVEYDLDFCDFIHE